MIVGVGNWASTVNALEALEEQTPSSATMVYEFPGMIPVITPPTFAVGPAGPTANVGGVITGIIPGNSYTIVADDGVCSSNASNAFTVDAQLPTPTITLTPNDPSVCNGTDGSILG